MERLGSREELTELTARMEAANHPDKIMFLI